MSWLWSSSKPADHSNDKSETSPKSQVQPSTSSFPSGPAPPQEHSASDPDYSQITEPSTSSPDPPPESAESKARNRDQIANDELLSFFRDLEAEREGRAKYEAAQALNDDDDDNADEEDDEPPELMTPARLYNSKMKCIELLDAAWFCASPGGQFFHLYRYGTLRYCGQLWKDMTVCWKINRTFYNTEKREQETLHRHWKRERDRLRERGGCSEEVWGEGRRWVLKNAFQADWEHGPWRSKNEGDDGRA